MVNVESQRSDLKKLSYFDGNGTKKPVAGGAKYSILDVSPSNPRSRSP